MSSRSWSGQLTLLTWTRPGPPCRSTIQPEVAGCPESMTEIKSRSLDFGFLVSSVWRGVTKRATPHGLRPIMGDDPSRAHGRVLDCCAGAPCSAWCLKTPSQTPIQIDQFWLPGRLRVEGGAKRTTCHGWQPATGAWTRPGTLCASATQPEVVGCPNNKKL